MQRTATCQCGALALTVAGEPALVSACNCTWCQRRSGSVFSVASRWREDQVVERRGVPSVFRRRGTSGLEVSIFFCPACGSTIMTKVQLMDRVIGIPVGAFADPAFPPPQVILWCDSKAAWVAFPENTLRLRNQTPPGG